MHLHHFPVVQTVTILSPPWHPTYRLTCTVSHVMGDGMVAQTGRVRRLLAGALVYFFIES